jgi:hypothetical protein
MMMIIKMMICNYKSLGGNVKCIHQTRIHDDEIVEDDSYEDDGLMNRIMNGEVNVHSEFLLSP